MECRVTDHNLDPIFWVGAMATFARGAQVALLSPFHSKHLPQPEATEVPVVDANSLIVLLAVRADVADAGPVSSIDRGNTAAQLSLWSWSLLLSAVVTRHTDSWSVGGVLVRHWVLVVGGIVATV